MKKIKVTLVRPEGCIHCEEVDDTLHELKKTYSGIEIEEVDILSDRGMEILQTYQVMNTPGILINDEWFDSGPISEERFRQKFETLQVTQ